MAYPPDPDEGQPGLVGLVQLPDGRYGYRYTGSDDVIILKRGPEGNQPGSFAV